MFDIELKNVRKGRIPYFVFAFIGLVFIVAIIAMIYSSIRSKKFLTSQVEAYKVEIKQHYDSEDGTMYTPIHYYNVNGVEYVCKKGGSQNRVSSSMEDKIVYYNPNDPSECTTEYAKSTNGTLYVFFGIFAIAFGVIGFTNVSKINKKIRTIKYLNYNGTLVKQLPYHMENTNLEVNGVRIKRPVAEYRLPNGEVVKLLGEGRHDRKVRDEDGYVDVLIDLNDPSKYFLDFEINRLTGNLDSDYYKPTKEEIERMKNGNQNVSQFNNNPYDKINYY